MKEAGKVNAVRQQPESAEMVRQLAASIGREKGSHLSLGGVQTGAAEKSGRKEESLSMTRRVEQRFTRISAKTGERKPYHTKRLCAPK